MVTGYLQVATAELVALDLLKYPDPAGGLNHIATVFSKLIETLDPIKLIELAKNTNSECQLQRIGYILDNIDLMDEDNAERTINSLALHVQKKKQIIFLLHLKFLKQVTQDVGSGELLKIQK